VGCLAVDNILEYVVKDPSNWRHSFDTRVRAYNMILIPFLAQIVVIHQFRRDIPSLVRSH
jgi:hypothetical protein